MFARTERLLLRPGWGEDAPALARAIADETIVRNLASVRSVIRKEGRAGSRGAARNASASAIP